MGYLAGKGSLFHPCIGFDVYHRSAVRATSTTWRSLWRRARKISMRTSDPAMLRCHQWTLWKRYCMTSPNGQALVNAFIMTQNMTQNMSSGCTGCTGLKNWHHQDVAEVLHDAWPGPKFWWRKTCGFSVCWVVFTDSSDGSFSHVFTLQLFKFHQVPTSSTFEEKEKAKKAKEKEDKQKASFSCAGENLVHTSHIFGIFWCRVSLILIDPHWFSWFREQLLRFWCNPSVPGQLITRSNDVPCHWGGSAVCRSDFFYSDPRGAPRHTTASSPIQRNFGRILLSEVHQGDTVPDAWSKRVTLEGRKIFDEFWCVISWVIRATPCEHYMGITMLCLRKTPQMWIFVESSESKMHCLPVTPLKQHQSH